jgi:Xaa-Pro aminopeptidase
MVLTLEPGIAYAATDGSRRVMVHEENLVVTENGPELLTRRAPKTLPVIEVEA